MTVIKPLQVICSSAACRRRQIVPGNRLWHVDVRSGPGSHREAGWVCRFCRTENRTPPSHLPRNTIQILPSRQEVLDRTLASTLERSGTNPDRNEASVSDGMDRGVRTAEGQRRQPRPMTVGCASSAVTGVGGTTSVPVDGLAAAYPRVREPDDRNESEQSTRSERPAPTWLVGHSAKKTLMQALSWIARHGGSGMTVCNGPNGFTAADVDLPDDANLNDDDMEAFADVLLGRLDEIRAEVLVLGGDVSGRPWQAILHFRTGAASFV